MKPGNTILFREGRTKGLGVATQVVPIGQTQGPANFIGNGKLAR